MARNESESIDIKNIVKSFKKAMHPTRFTQQNTRFWTYPDNCDIYLLTPNNEFMFQISTSVITGMSVNYTATEAGVPAFFGSTGAPVALTMALNFKEIGLLTKEKIEQGY